MARPRHKERSDICADCGTLGINLLAFFRKVSEIFEPSWASLNRAILLCDECCSIHRSLGRHISHIKFLHKGPWSTSLLKMVRTLHDSGANNIWEHSLLDPNNSKTSRRKPQSKDLLHPVKEDFIRAKHQQLSFILRPSKEEFCTEEEISRQLHSSVRTSNLETSLRLLAQGANPNYFYKEKGTTPLHVAARAGQSLQIELLITNGGNPSIVDSSGHSPSEVAKMAGHLELSDRLIEYMYEVTDKLSFFLCGQKPNHKAGQHLIVPEWSVESDRSELAFGARNKLQMLPNHLLEELAMDVYDEVDRRETDAIWLSVASLPDRCAVPFLPVNPRLSSTRNQGRQKLARFTPKELATLVIDLLTEAGHRHTLANNAPLQDPVLLALRKEQFGKHGSQMSDDEPLYDSVASDDDYATFASDNVTRLSTALISDNEKALAPLAKGLPSVVEVLRKQLNLSESTIRDLREEIRCLQSSIERILEENRELKNMIQAKTSEAIINGHIGGEQDPELEPVLDMKTIIVRGNQRPTSMYETREGLRKPSTWNANINQAKREIESPARPCTTQSLWEYGAASRPPREEVTRRTGQVTKRIQELWNAMQDPSHREAFVPCAERIRVAVAELAAIFPQNPVDENVRSALRQLNGNTGRLQAECAGLQRCTSDPDHMDRCLQQVRSCAYDIAKATKLLVTQFQAI
ncbi:ARF GTPase-activating protein GIT1 isoform X3 [Belonocnema kinseyi]|uniref:ARF GTPase-activating protein GIT1 isoform X3 n=1 Tax=Belonocnema kinseyi TaxID=2817044 RepID=UPI00143CD794|nr:ARF GTPase-activating protein GIT1 isoform X3 [Belonocnema kinseyi]